MEILQNLLENDLLTEETKAELETAIQTQISEAVESAVNEAKEKTEAAVRAELAEQFVLDKEALVEAIDTKINVFLEEELEEFREDVENFRNLEVEFAEKEVAMKAQLAEVAKQDFAKLVDILDEFLDEQVEAVFEELREDIEVAKQNTFGQEIFESVKDKFERDFFDADRVKENAANAQRELERTQQELKEARAQLAENSRQQAINEALSNLNGKPYEVMKAILAKTPEKKVKAVYEQFIGRVLNMDTVEDDTEKESKVLAEDSKPGKTETLTETAEVKGDGKGPVVESVESDEDHPRLSKAQENRLRELAGTIG